MKIKRIHIAIVALFLGYVLLVSCGTPATPPSSSGIHVTNDSQVYTWHDDKNKVTCWLYGYQGGISCIPDWQLTPPETR